MLIQFQRPYWYKMKLTLEPGDIIATGTAAGVGIGYSPPKYLKEGDRIVITIEPIGRLESPVVN